MTQKCRRCGDPMVMFVVGDDYCAPCRRDLKAREPKPVANQPLWMRRLTAKDMSDWRPVA